MKRSTFRIFSLAIILSITISPLISCKGSISNEDNTDIPVSSVRNNTEESTETYNANIPAGTNYGGEDFKILVNKRDIFVWGDVDFVTDGETGEAINDAVYLRNRTVEGQLNINIVPVESSNQGLQDEMKKSILAEDHAFDIAFPSTISASALAQQGYLQDLQGISTINLSSPWWDQNSINDLSVANKLFMMTGDIGTMYKKSIGCFMFNKKLVKDFGLDDPYALVDKKQWTVDKLVEMSKSVSKDLDGDGKNTDADMYGLIYFGDLGAIGLIGAGVKFADKDESDLPIMSFNSEKTNDVFTKYAELFSNNQIAFNWATNNRGNDGALPVFQDNRSLFYFGEFHQVAQMRAMDTDFGIIPLPLYDTNQDSYHHVINPHVAPMVTVPVSNSDLEKTGYILEALGAASKNLLTPAYYDITLKGKATRDDQSEAYLDLILATIRYDIGYLNSWGGLGDMIINLAMKPNATLSSKYEAIEGKIVSDMESAINYYSDIEVTSKN